VGAEGAYGTLWKAAAIIRRLVDHPRCNLNKPMFYEVRNTMDTPHLLQHDSLIQHVTPIVQNPMIFDNKFFIILLCPVADGPATDEALARKENFQDIVVVILDSDFSDCLWKRYVERILGKRCVERILGKRCEWFSRIIFEVFKWRN
jgi:hypothetical protein